LIGDRKTVTVSPMKILAIDTALPAVSACVLTEGATSPDAEETLGMERGHAEALIPLIERVMSHVEGGFAAIDRVGVTVGPGSFTGLRVGIAAARAIALCWSIPAVGVSTLAALAAPLILEEKPGIVVVAVDARHGHVFFAAFHADGRIMLLPRFAAKDEAVKALGDGPLRLAGSGAPILAIEAWQRGIVAEIVGDRIVPDITYVARLGLLADPATAPPRPLYLKAPDAKPPARAVLAPAPEPA
jgi:tRNA threonylcarbamoyladenosine biosynthesis protein TsaB